MRDLLAAVADRTTAPGGGASAALATALAAALAEMAARFADESAAAAELVGAADRLRERAAGLADADVEAYGDFVRARRERADDLGAALDRAVQVPIDVASTAAEVGRIARGLADDGNPRLRGDAATACWLAAAAAQSAAVLVAANLARTPDDPRIAEARDLARDAHAFAATLPG